MSINPAPIHRLLTDAIRDYGIADPRSQQSRDGILGPSDIGFCRQKAALTTRGVPQSDEKSIAAAQIGTAIHRYAAEAFKAANPEWIVDDVRVTATLPSGVEISGTPDLILPDLNALIDIKTVDGFEWVKREGTSQNHKMQRHLYALGAIQAGLLQEDTLIVGNLYIDRSGKEAEPFLIVEDFDPSLTVEIDSWIGDVIYAVKNGEDASRDIPAPVCEKICEFFSVCRGDLPTFEGGESIEDLERVTALRMYVEGRDLAKTGEQMKKEAQSRLFGTNGIAVIDDKRVQIRWTHINASTVQAFEKQAYDRMDVRVLK